MTDFCPTCSEEVTLLTIRNRRNHKLTVLAADAASIDTASFYTGNFGGSLTSAVDLGGNVVGPYPFAFELSPKRGIDLGWKLYKPHPPSHYLDKVQSQTSSAFKLSQEIVADSSALLPGYTWVDNPNGGGNTYSGPPYYPYKPVILLHQTVGTSLSRSYVENHQFPPHLWANPYTGDKWQTIPLDRAALALYQPQYGFHWTNKHTYMIQTELVGIPDTSGPTYTDSQCKWIGENVIAPIVLWFRANGLPFNIDDVRWHTNASGAASVDWPGRMTEQEFADFNGVCAHIDSWGNDHWDCGCERLDLMVAYAKQMLGGGGTPPVQGDDDEVMDLILNRDNNTVYARFGPFAIQLNSQAALGNWKAWGWVKNVTPLELTGWQLDDLVVVTPQELAAGMLTLPAAVAQLSSKADEIAAKIVAALPKQTPLVGVDYDRIKADVRAAINSAVIRVS